MCWTRIGSTASVAGCQRWHGAGSRGTMCYSQSLLVIQNTSAIYSETMTDSRSVPPTAGTLPAPHTTSMWQASTVGCSRAGPAAPSVAVTGQLPFGLAPLAPSRKPQWQCNAPLPFHPSPRPPGSSNQRRGKPLPPPPALPEQLPLLTKAGAVKAAPPSRHRDNKLFFLPHVTAPPLPRPHPRLPPSLRPTLVRRLRGSDDEKEGTSEVSSGVFRAPDRAPERQTEERANLTQTLPSASNWFLRRTRVASPGADFPNRSVGV